MRPQYTPGPWRVESAQDSRLPTGKIWLVTAGEEDTWTVVAECAYAAPKANAILISTLPDLLAFAAKVAKQLHNDPILAERKLAYEALDLIAKVEG